MKVRFLILGLVLLGNFSCKKKDRCVVCNGEKIGCEGTYNPAEWEFVSWEAWKATKLINPDCQEEETE